MRDSLVEATTDRLADLPPVETARRPPLGQRAQMLADFLEREPQALDDQDKAEPADIAAQEAALIAGGAQRRDQPLVLVKPDRGDREASAARQFTDGKKVGRFHGYSR